MAGSRILTQIQEIGSQAGFTSVGVAYQDYETSLRFSYHGERFFHAASTFKAVILLALFKAAEEGKLRLNDPLRVRNRFLGPALLNASKSGSVHPPTKQSG